MKTSHALTFLILQTLFCASLEAKENSLSEAQAKVIAEKEFIRYTNHRITHYSIGKGRQTETTWLYVINELRYVESEHKYLPPPGCNWFIEIDKANGKATINEGR